MKRLLKLSLPILLSSIVPIGMWMLFGFVFEEEYSTGFMLGYILQHLYGLLYNVFVLGSLKYETVLDDDCNHATTGLVLFVVSSILLIVGCYAGQHVLVWFFKLSDLQLFLFLICGVYMIYDWIIFGIGANLQYKEKDKLAMLLSTVWHLQRVAVFFIVYFCIDGTPAEIMTSHAMAEGFICLIFFLATTNFHKLSISLLNYVRYSQSALVCSIGMFVTYTFGIQALNVNPAHLAAYNAMTLCSDTQWDLEGYAVDTYATLEAAEDDWSAREKSVFWNCTVYSIVLVLTSCLMLALYGIGLSGYIRRLSWEFLVIEMTSFVPYVIVDVFVAYVQLRNPVKELSILTAIKYVVRFTVQTVLVLFFGVYGISWSCTLTVIFSLVVFGNLYKHSIQK